MNQVYPAHINNFVEENVMTVKKIFIGIAAAVILTFAACSGRKDAAGTAPMDLGPAGQLPVVKEKATYTIGASIGGWSEPRDGEFWKIMEEETNVHIEWVTAVSDADSMFTLMMSSGDYPDAFIGGWGGTNTNILRYGVDEKAYIPLTKLIPEHMPIFMKRAVAYEPDILRIQTAPDGEIYSLPGLGGDDALNAIPSAAFINKTWLDKLGLRMPTTLDEFENVLLAFKTRDPNGNGIADEIPMSFNLFDWGAYDITSYFGAFGYPLSPSDLTLVVNGKVIFNGTEPGFKEGAAWFAKLYAEGLIDREMFSTGFNITAKQSADPMILGVFNAWANYSENHFDDFVTLLPLKGPKGDQNWFYRFNNVSRDQFIITNKAKNPEILLRWVDQMYRDFQTGFSCAYGIGPDPNKYWYYDDEGNMVLNPNVPPEYDRSKQGLPFVPSILEPEPYVAVMSSAPGVYKEKSGYLDSYMPYVQKFTSNEWSIFPDIVFTTSDEASELSILQTEIVTYTKNQLARWISGDGNINTEWDAYLRELNVIGLPRYLELKQAIYDRFTGK
jgi:putative aldouronate transport system substrate-binding protein